MSDSMVGHQRMVAGLTLMLAGDDLLEACKAAEDAMCRATFDLRGRHCRDLNNAIDLCKSAIAKATSNPTENE